MSTTTFSGPVKAGNIFNRTGNTLGDNVANQGQATMVQVAEIAEATDDPSWTGIVIPANSQIIRMAILTITVGVHQVYIGRYDSVSTDEDYFVDGLIWTSNGLKDAAAKSNNLSAWKDTGALDVHLTLKVLGEGGGSDTGVGILIVEYIQNNNLTP